MTDLKVMVDEVIYMTSEEMTKGDKGDPGPKGDPFTYEDFTNEQLEALRGPKGDPGYTPQKGVDYADGEDGVSPIVSIDKKGKITTITITDSVGVHTVTINDGADGDGSGDMTMATYDIDGDGIVNEADNAVALGGVAASEYALKTDIPAIPTAVENADKLGGITADQYALKTDIPEVADTAKDSEKLGGIVASEYVLKSDIPEVVAPILNVTDDGNGNVVLTLG